MVSTDNHFSTGPVQGSEVASEIPLNLQIPTLALSELLLLF